MARKTAWKSYVISIVMLAAGLVTTPARADDIPACGGLYTYQYNRCTLPTGLIEYALEIAGGSGGAGSKTDVSIPSPYAKITGANGGRGRLYVLNLPNSGSQSEIVIGIGHRGKDGVPSNYLSEIAGGVAAAGSQGGASWGGRDFGGSPIAGTSGGSGGGASDIRTVASDPSTRLLVAGGGGGGGAGNFSAHEGGQGGDAESNGNSSSRLTNQVQTGSSLGLGTAGRCPDKGLGGGGGAGTQNSGGGGGGSGCAISSMFNNSVGAAGAVGQAGGDVAANNGYGGRPGTLGIGGSNGQGVNTISGGAGGGGFFGGGAGGDGGQSGAGGGGGGGSSLLPTGAVLVNSDWNAGDGYAIISAITSSLPNVQQSINASFQHQLGVTGFSTSTSQVGLNVTYAMSGAPSGISINSSTGLISGTFQEAGDFTIQVTASAGWPNGGNIRSIQQFKLSVSKLSQTSTLNISKTMKKKSSKTFTVENLKTSAGQKIVLSTSGACSLKATYKNVKTKVGKKTKYVKTLSGYKITMGKKARQTCTVIEAADPTTSLNAFSKSTVISIK